MSSSALVGVDESLCQEDRKPDDAHQKEQTQHRTDHRPHRLLVIVVAIVIVIDTGTTVIGRTVAVVVVVVVAVGSVCFWRRNT